MAQGFLHSVSRHWKHFSRVRYQVSTTLKQLQLKRCSEYSPDIFHRLTYQVGAPIPITGVQFGMRVEFGYDCLVPADFNNDVS